MHVGTEDATLWEQAVRVDEALGIIETVEFFGDNNAPLFGHRLEPANADLRGSVVFCPSIWTEFAFNYRAEVLLARTLAASGYAVQRFHYRGTGHSAGESAGVTFDCLRADALAAAQCVGGSDHGLLVFSGIRWGGLVAASAASSFPNAAVALWEPVVDPMSFFEEAFRTKQMRAATDSGNASASKPPAPLLEQLLASGSVDLIGNVLTREFYETSIRRRLSCELSGSSRRIMLAYPESKREYCASVEGLASCWRDGGFDVEIHSTDLAFAWWFFGQRPIQSSRTAQRMAEFLIAWLIDLRGSS